MIIKVGGLEPLGPIGVYAYDRWLAGKSNDCQMDRPTIPSIIIIIINFFDPR